MTVAGVFELRQCLCANGYPPVPIYNRQKRPKGNGWRLDAFRDPPVWAERMPEDDALGTGIATRDAIGIDIDVLIQEVTDKIVWAVECLLGPTPLSRIGLAPKILLVYRGVEVFPKLTTGAYLMPNGSEATVEILADGQQFVAEGIHPDTGEPYSWPDLSPDLVPLTELPTISLEQAQAIIATARRLLLESGGTERRPAPDEARAVSSGHSDFFVLASALAVISGADDYQTWIAIGAALHGATDGSYSGRDLWAEWSRRSSKYDGEALIEKWRTFGRHTGTSAGAGSIFHLAQQHGWRFPRPPEAKPTPGEQARTSPDLLSLENWLVREVATPDFLLGDVISTTSRVEIIGPTGLGKTNLGLAMAMAMAGGSNFLHWRGCERPRRILYIDGEMSRRLMKQRLVDAVRRHGSAPTTLYVLNREDFAALPPLDTVAGQQFIDSIILRVGGVDCLLLDNVQALLAGDMKDEEPWERTLPWVRDLTQRQIGQVWFHHTGHDETHGYGSKTREWQLDTVALMESVERPDVDLAFNFRFTKARERTPDNRSDFEPSVITLHGDEWVSQRGPPQSRKAPARDQVLTLLIDAVARDGVIPPANSHIPPHTPCITEKLWRDICRLGCISDSTPDSQDKAFRRAAKILLDKGLIGKWKEMVWVVRSSN